MKHLLVLFLIFSSNISFSQVTTGSLIYELTEVDSSNHWLIQNMEMLIHFTPEEQVTIKKNIENDEVWKEYQYFDGLILTHFLEWPRIKTRTETDISTFEELGFDPDRMALAYNITIDKSDTKEILGFTCYKTTIVIDMNNFEEGAGPPTPLPPGVEPWHIIAYVTEDIELLDFNLQQFRGIKYSGTPLMWTMRGFSTIPHTIRATSFEEKIDYSVFEYPDNIFDTEDPTHSYTIIGRFGF